MLCSTACEMIVPRSGKSENSTGSLISDDAEQDVVVVARKRRDHIRLVAELDERHQIVVLALQPELHELLGGGDRGVERRPGLRARLERLGLERRRHAGRRVDHDGDAAARKRDVFAHEGRVRIAERKKRERQAQREQGTSGTWRTQAARGRRTRARSAGRPTPRPPFDCARGARAARGEPSTSSSNTRSTSASTLRRASSRCQNWQVVERDASATRRRASRRSASSAASVCHARRPCSAIGTCGMTTAFLSSGHACARRSCWITRRAAASASSARLSAAGVLRVGGRREHGRARSASASSTSRRSMRRGRRQLLRAPSARSSAVIGAATAESPRSRPAARHREPRIRGDRAGGERPSAHAAAHAHTPRRHAARASARAHERWRPATLAARAARPPARSPPARARRDRTPVAPAVCVFGRAPSSARITAGITTRTPSATSARPTMLRTRARKRRRLDRTERLAGRVANVGGIGRHQSTRPSPTAAAGDTCDPVPRATAPATRLSTR